MGWKEFSSDYLHFSRKDRIAILVLVGLILLIFFLPKAISSKNKEPTTNEDSSWITAMKNLERKDAERNQSYNQYEENNSSFYQYDRTKSNYAANTRGELFEFDPNTLSKEGWLKLGLREKTIGIIQNYLSKGGKFRQPEDLKKVYGLFPNEYERIAPYITIAAPVETNGYKDFSKESNYTLSPKTFTPKYSVIEINTSDTTAFISLPGIGSKLSARIINFREKLGGFYSIAQVGETFGLPDSTFQKIKPYLKIENSPIKKININTATIDELKAHPYIRWAVANPVVAYRNQHGPFEKIEDLKKIMVVTDEVYGKIAPYLTIQ